MLCWLRCFAKRQLELCSLALGLHFGLTHSGFELQKGQLLVRSNFLGSPELALKTVLTKVQWRPPARSSSTCLYAPSLCRCLLSLSRSAIPDGSRLPPGWPHFPDESWTV